MLSLPCTAEALLSSYTGGLNLYSGLLNLCLGILYLYKHRGGSNSTQYSGDDQWRTWECGVCLQVCQRALCGCGVG